MPAIYRTYTLKLPDQQPLQVKGYSNTLLGKLVRWIRRDSLEYGGFYLKRGDLAQKFFTSLTTEYHRPPSKEFKKNHPIRKELAKYIKETKEDFQLDSILEKDLFLKSLEHLKNRYESLEIKRLHLVTENKKKKILDLTKNKLEENLKEESSLEAQVEFIRWFSLYVFFSLLFEQRDEEQERTYVEHILQFEGPVSPLITPLYAKSIVYHTGEKTYNEFTEKALEITEEQLDSLFKEAEKSYFPKEKKAQLRLCFNRTVRYKSLLKESWKEEELDLLTREVGYLSSFYPSYLKRACEKGLARAMLKRQKARLEKEASDEKRIEMLELFSLLPFEKERQEDFKEAVEALYSKEFQKSIKRLAKEDPEHPLLKNLLISSLFPENKRPLEDIEKALFQKIRFLFFSEEGYFKTEGYQKHYKALVGKGSSKPLHQS